MVRPALFCFISPLENPRVMTDDDPEYASKNAAIEHIWHRERKDERAHQREHSNEDGSSSDVAAPLHDDPSRVNERWRQDAEQLVLPP